MEFLFDAGERRAPSRQSPRRRRPYWYAGSMAIDAERLKGLAGFRRGLRRFLAASEKISREAGVTSQQYQMLLAIKAAGSSELAMKISQMSCCSLLMRRCS
jgi:hypothetical protein